jgi:hypothetical protein
MSGGLGDVKHPVEVTAKPALVPPAFYKLDPATVGQKVHMPLDCPDRPVERLSKPGHLWPAEPALVVGIIAQCAVGWDNLSRDTGGNQLIDLRDTGKFCRHSLPFPAAGAL